MKWSKEEEEGAGRKCFLASFPLLPPYFREKRMEKWGWVGEMINILHNRQTLRERESRG